MHSKNNISLTIKYYQNRTLQLRKSRLLQVLPENVGKCAAGDTKIDGKSVIFRPTDLRLKSVATASGKRLSPSPSRRQSQPMPPSGSQFGSPVRVRKGSQPGTPTGDTTRPKSFHPTPSSDNAAPPTLSSAPGSNTNIYQR